MKELDTSAQIAIIGMAGRFPQADDVKQLWENLLNSHDSLELLSTDELLKLGLSQQSIDRKGYVAAARVLTDIEYFDYAFFGLSRREAELMDPQIRLLIQCAYNTFEDARITLQQQDSSTGVYVGVAGNRYLIDHILPNKALVNSVGAQMIQIVNEKDFAATQVAYRLNLTGPAVNVNTACSTSLVAVHNAVQALLAYECDMALAGGASITPMQRIGYQYQPGSIASPDGRCRPFDAEAQGTSYGSGVATVLLKRFDEALADGDKVYAVIRASAINNDGSEKIGFTAPSIKGQARVISEAIELAELEAQDISYIEAHGTATHLGDPIEFEALNQVFAGVNAQSCGIGSIKSNIGHLDTAAGIAGLIKTSLSIYHGQIPATLHFNKANPEIDIDNSPFHVVDQLRSWPSPRIAGTSSFGMGGTNAHVIVTEPSVESSIESSVELRTKGAVDASSKQHNQWHLLPITANDSEVLVQLQASYQTYFNNTDERPDDISWSLFHTRKAMPVRSFIVADSVSNAAELLKQTQPFKETNDIKKIAFMFPGQGSQQLAMATQLSEHFPAYQTALEQALSQLKEQTLVRNYLFEQNEQCETRLLQPALFCHEYALTQLWQALGAHPSHLIGHSLGEYVAACVAGVFSLSEAIKIVEMRAHLMSEMQTGAMLAVRANQSELVCYLNTQIELAAVNGPKNCVLAGPIEAITKLKAQLKKDEFSFQQLKTSHAFHSAAVEPILDKFHDEMASFTLNPAKIPVVSNVTGTWLTAQQATDPQYWCQHIRHAVLFNAGIQTLVDNNIDCYIEVGTGKTLSHFALAAGLTSDKVISGLSGQEMASHDFLTAAGHFWTMGGTINTAMLCGKNASPVDLPLYPFKKSRAWLSPNKTQNSGVQSKNFASPQIYQTLWQSQRIAESHNESHDELNNNLQDNCWLFLADNPSFAKSLVQNLCANAQHISIISSQQLANKNGQITAESVAANWHESIAPLFEQNKPCQIINCWPLDYSKHSDYSENGDSLFNAIGHCAKILSDQLYATPITMTTLTDRALNTSDGVCQHPIQSLAHSMPIVMQQEINGLIGQIIDLDFSTGHKIAMQQLSAEFNRKERIPIRALRGQLCWQPRFVKLLKNNQPEQDNWIKPTGHYLITGGLGQLGLTLSHWLIEQPIMALTLVTRSNIPDQSQWQKLVEDVSTDESLSVKLKHLIEIESKIQQLTILDAAWHSEQSVRDGINTAELINGPITGIFHSAAHFDQHTFQPLNHFDAQNAIRQFTTKVDVTHAIRNVIQDKNVDFVVLMSSLSAVFAGLGHGIYSAANKYLDALASQSSSHTQWLSIAWDAWNVSADSGKGSISRDEAPLLFDSLFRNHGHCTLSVSCQDMEARFDQWVRQAHHHIAPSSDAKKHVTEQSDIEHILETCWQDIIGIEKCTPEAHFFALGGDSLAAVRLSGLIQQRMNINITAAEIFANASFQDMLKQLTAQNNTASDSLLVPLRAGKGEPILLIHPGGGGIDFYKPMLDQLDLDNPFYGIRARGVDAGSQPRLYKDMKELACDYASELITYFKGPSITLIGYCFGGLIANELSHAFKKHDISTSHLILIDSTHPAIRPPTEISLTSYLNEMFADMPDVNIEALSSVDPQDLIQEVVKQAKKSGYFPQEVSDQQAENYIRLSENHLALELSYKPETAEAMVLLRAKDEHNNDDQTGTLGWADVPIIDVPGDHKTMIALPHVAILAQKIMEILCKKT